MGVLIVKNCVCVHVSVCTHEHSVHRRQKKALDVNSPEVEVTGGCELPDMCAGNSTPVLYKNRQHMLLTTEPSISPAL